MYCSDRSEKHGPGFAVISQLEAMDNSLPLHLCHVRKSISILNRLYTLVHSTALLALLYYRVSFLFQIHETRPREQPPTFPWFLLFAGELVLSLIWLLGQAYRWRSVTRTLFPERLPDDKHLPAIDVFICTADQTREPTFGVMNTVVSAMALDYPPERLHVYVSDDGGSSVTLQGMREAWAFARLWLPFCRTYGIKTRCPEVYFSRTEDDEFRGPEFLEEREKIKMEFELFRERVRRATENGGSGDKRISGDHPSTVEVIGAKEDDIPTLVYVSREKRPAHPHHFKAGALNVLVRVSSMISNSPYILVLDCDMYCNDPNSARQAMCCHLDPKLSPSLAFVQFPQYFHNISACSDIYDSQMRTAFSTCWGGMDGLDGPVLSGTGFYMKRVALYGTSIQDDDNASSHTDLRQTFGDSDEFIKSLSQKHSPNISHDQDTLNAKILQETRLLASCQYENQTKWGEEVGVLYHSVAEDVVTGYTLHCRGWRSVLCVPSRAQFLGSSVTNLNDLLVQGTRWSSGLVDVGLSKFCPFVYGPFMKTSFLHNICYAQLSFFPFYFFPVWCFATIPQLCLFNAIPLYPEVSSPFFWVFVFVFLSSHSKEVAEVVSTGGSVRTWSNEQKIWMIKSVTSHMYGSADAVMKRLGARKASFLPTNKAAAEDHVKLYQMGKFDFRISTAVLTSMVTLVVLNAAAFVAGVGRAVVLGNWDDEETLMMQVLLSLYILIMGYPVIEGMVVRKDKGRIPYSVTLLSILLAVLFLTLGSIIL